MSSRRRLPKHTPSGDIHIHDKDFYALTETCCQIDLLKLFQDGFSTSHGYLREPNDIRSYAALACIAIQANQNATYQAMEALVHNLNTMHSRAGAQVPFSSFNYGTDTSPEGRMVMQNLLLATEAVWATAKHPFSRFIFSRSRKASTTTRAIRTTTCSSWRCAAPPSAVPEFQLS